MRPKSNILGAPNTGPRTNRFFHSTGKIGLLDCPFKVRSVTTKSKITFPCRSEVRAKDRARCRRCGWCRSFLVSHWIISICRPMGCQITLSTYTYHTSPLFKALSTALLKLEVRNGSIHFSFLAIKGQRTQLKPHERNAKTTKNEVNRSANEGQNFHDLRPPNRGKRLRTTWGRNLYFLFYINLVITRWLAIIINTIVYQPSNNEISAKFSLLYSCQLILTTILRFVLGELLEDRSCISCTNLRCFPSLMKEKNFPQK